MKTYNFRESESDLMEDLNKYRILSIILIFISIIPMGFGETPITYTITCSILIISFLISRKYRCPYCGKVFDIRTSSKKIYYCVRCGKKL
ncbi:hypothetical protein [Vallitalea sp.]|jgi:DNA-directed RNA polymerase subunit RPC12/RpoP|uniref:hypothetical protein n=1 Tax=Vallitalea sp. TaxID=1882829 RepID=UPI0025FDA6F4|nr:hypothetical protein [Vallitalea sp.]MCT4687499.1 hypothetical protein [Vallitalea sp.]